MVIFLECSRSFGKLSGYFGECSRSFGELSGKFSVHSENVPEASLSFQELTIGAQKGIKRRIPAKKCIRIGKGVVF